MGNASNPQQTRVILIGGAPLSGKSTAARIIGRILDLPVIATDHLGEAVRALTSASTHGDLHACSSVDYRKYYISYSPQQLLEHALRAQRALWPAIEKIIARHLDWDGPAIVEGWALLPDLVCRLSTPALRSVWVETPEIVLRARLAADESFVRGADDPALLIERFVARSACFGTWLRQQSTRANLPHIVLSGSESPEQVASLCLKALGLARAEEASSK